MAFLDVLAQIAPAAGTLIGGPVGGAVGTLVSGMIQGAGADKAKEEFQKSRDAIPLQDPNIVAHLGDIQSRRRHLERGTDTFTSIQKQDLGNRIDTTTENIMRSGGGVGEQLRAVNAGARGAAQIAGSAAGSVNQLLAQEGFMARHMEDRLFKMQASDTERMWSEYARKRSDAQRTTMASIGMLPQVKLSKSAPNPGQPSSATMTEQINSYARGVGALSQEPANAMTEQIGAYGKGVGAYSQQEPNYWESIFQPGGILSPERNGYTPYGSR